MKKYLNVIICFVIISLNKNVFSQHSDLSGVIDTKVCQSGIREDNTNYIYCARQSLQKIPMLSINNNNGAAVSNIVYDELVLSDNLIERIDFNSFGSNFKVRKLYLDNNPLRFIHKSSFEHVRNYLEELYLEQKQIKATTIADSDEVYDEGSELRNGYILDENDSNLFEAAVFQKCFNLHLLSLKSYRIPHLKANMFLKMTKLETLILASNRLRQIDEAAFAGLEHSLTYLNLDSNHLEWVPSKPLERMKKLKRLSLSQNRIKTLHANAFFYLNSLNTLDLSYNYLSRFDENAFSGSVQNSLRSLQLQNNELKWPHYIYILYNLHLLQDLNLDFNKLGQKAINIQIKPEEENLLRFNEDKKVNNSSSVYLQLASISMQGNGLTDQIIKSIFAEAHDYERLRANEYFIVNPSTANSFANENNRKLFVYSSLTKFNLARNKLTTISKDFFIKTNMTYLKTLILEKNPFINAHELRFTGLEKSLLNLNLNSVGFNLYSIDSLYSLENLQTLKLNANSKSKSIKPLTKSSNNSFFNNLISLELQNNNLKELPEYLCGLHSLNDLDLSSNNLASFNSLDCLLFKSDLSVKLKQLNLNNNPLKCDCSMRKLKIWLMRNYEKDLLDLIRWQCAEPNDLNGRYFANLDLNELKCHLPAPAPTTTAPISLASTTAKIETTTHTSAITKALIKILIPYISRTSTITLKTVTSTDQKVSKMASVESTKEQAKLFDLDNSTLILIAIAFGLMFVVLLVLIMLYMSCFRSSNEKLQFLNKYEHRQFFSPSSMTSSSSNSTTSTTTTAARTKTNKNNDSFSRNSQLTLLSNELLLKLNKQQTSNESCNYYEKNLKELNFFQLNEEFRPFNNSSVSKGNLISSKQPVYTIDQNENHIYHEINTPVKYLSYQNPYDSPYESNFNYFMFPTAENSNANPNNQYSGLIV